MNLENQPQTVKSGPELSLPKKTSDDDDEDNTDVFPEKCECIENTTCEYCCIEEYKKAWRVLQQQPLILSRRDTVICRSKTANDGQQEITERTKCDTDSQSEEEPSVKCDTDVRGSTELDGTSDADIQTSDKLRVNWDTDFRYNEVPKYVDSDSEETKDADFSSYNVEQSNDSWVAQDPDCPVGASSRALTDAETCDSNVQSHDLLDANHEIDQLDSDDSNTCLSEETKNANICRTDESCDIKANDTDSSLKRKLSKIPATEVFTDSVGESCKRTRRNSKRKKDVKDSCPICDLTIRSCELESHFAKEVENLSKIHKGSKKITGGGSGVSTEFVQVKSNRENRLAAKIAKYTKKTRKQVLCSVCGLALNGTEEENGEHIFNCCREDFQSDIDILDNDDSFEEYEFGDETRVRAISLVPGGYRALYGHSSTSKTTDENDEDLNIDVDDTLKYGKPQYSELDVIPNLTDAEEAKQLEEYRKAVTDPTVEPNVLESRKWSNITDKETEKSEIGSLEKTDKTENDSKSENLMIKTESAEHDVIVSSLKERIKHLEDPSKNVKCLICLEPYTKPVVSTACWHVYCEECWLMTMGIKKLCPQCSIIVVPSDLRRIYL